MTMGMPWRACKSITPTISLDTTQLPSAMRKKEGNFEDSDKQKNKKQPQPQPHIT
jgi:hypothetical protein